MQIIKCSTFFILVCLLSNIGFGEPILNVAGLANPDESSIKSVQNEKGHMKRLSQKSKDQSGNMPRTLKGPVFRQVSRLKLNLASSSCKILSPASGAYPKIARNLALELERTTGSRPEIVADTTEPTDLGSGSLIVLGNLMDSKAARKLYLSAYDFTDLGWPGPGGHVVRTIYDPFETGAHVLIVGGSDAGGVERAANRLAAVVRKSGPLLGYVNEVELGEYAGAIRARSNRFLGSDAEVWSHIGLWGSWQLESNIGTAARGYLRTGNEDYLEAFRKQIFWFIDHDVQTLKQGKQQMIHARVKAMLLPWDLMRDHPFFSDSDRAKIDRAFLYIARSREGARGVGKTRRLLSNHDSGQSLDAYFLGRYFLRRYGLEEAKDWLDRAAKSFRYQLQSAKPWEDYEVHETTTLLDTLVYAMVSGHKDYFSSQAFKEAADRMIMYHPAGTVLAYSAACAAATGDSGYLTLAVNLTPEKIIKQLLGTEGVFIQPFCACDRITPREDLLGVTVAPLDGIWYEMYAKPFSRGRSRLAITIPVEEGFDKITIREGWKSDDFFMLFDGISGGKGSEHKDNANCIIDYREHGYQWIVLWPRGDHPIIQNRLYVSLDAHGAGKRHCLARLMYAGQVKKKYFFLGGALEKLGFSDWERHVLRKNRCWTAIIDRVLVRKSGALNVDRYWLLKGKVTPSGDGALSRQGDSFFHLRTVGFPSEGMSGATNRRETVRVQVKKGECLEFGAILYTDKDENNFRYGLERTVGGWRVTDTKGPPVGFRVTSNGVRLFDEAAKVMEDVPEIKALPLSVSASPIELPWKTTALGDKITAVAVHAGLIGAGTGTGTVFMFDSNLKKVWQAAVKGSVLSLHFFGNGLLVGTDNRGTLSYFDDRGNKVWQVSMPYKKVTWPYWTQQEGRVNEITSADLDGDGRDEILVTNGNGFSYAYDAEGKQLWCYRQSAPKGVGGASTVARYRNRPVLLLGLFCPSFMAGCNILGGGGYALRGFTPAHIMRTTTCDLRYVEPEGQNRAAIFCASHISCNQLEAYASDGKLVWEEDTASAARTIVLCEKDGKRQVICGTGDGYVLAVEAEKGKRLWTCYVGESPLLVWPLSNDRVTAVCTSGMVYVISREGKLLGSQNLGSPVTAVLRPGDHRSGTDMIPVGTAGGGLHLLKGKFAL